MRRCLAAAALCYLLALDAALCCILALDAASERMPMAIDTQRRKFVAALGGMAAWPFAARAQQTKKPTIGLLGGATASAQAQWTAALVQRLRELGWVEDQTVAIEYRWLEGRFERTPAIIAEFVRLKVD